MSAKADGGLAFPYEEHNSEGAIYRDHYGISARDYFAAKAMPTMISMCQYADGAWDHATVAQNAYALADAMLAERAEGEQS